MQISGPSFLEKISKQYSIYFELLSVFLLGALMITRWLERFQIWPDSANYLTAAMSFAQKGTLLVNLNWPLMNLDFNPQYLSTYPPGYALFLSFFSFFTNDPIFVAAVGQSVVLALLIFCIYQATRALEFPPFLRIATIAFFYKFEAFGEITSSLLTESLYIALTLGIFILSLRLLENPNSRRVWLFSLGLLLFASSVRWNGFSNASFFLLPLWGLWRISPRKTSLKFFFVGICACAPNLLWFIRNKLALGSTTGFYSFEGILWHKALYPFEHTASRWGIGSYWGLLVLLGFCLTPILWKSTRVNLDFRTYTQILVGIVVQFFAIYLLSLVLNITPVDDRYLSPSYTFIAILLFFAASILVKSWGSFSRRFSSLLFVLFAFAIPVMAVASMIRMNSHPFMQVKEKILWDQIKAEPFFSLATHFYSDENWNHQIFSQIPQKILWPNLYKGSQTEIDRLSKLGKNSFFVFDTESDFFRKNENIFANTKHKYRQKRAGKFIIYYLESTFPN